MTIQRGEIYFVNLNPIQGREQSGQRPVLILSIDAINRLPLVVTGVVGTKGENIPRECPTNVRVAPTDSGLPMETVFDERAWYLIRKQRELAVIVSEDP